MNIFTYGERSEIYSCGGNAKSELCEETKERDAERTRNGSCVRGKKGIPLGYVIKLRNE